MNSEPEKLPQRQQGPAQRGEKGKTDEKYGGQKMDNQCCRRRLRQNKIVATLSLSAAFKTPWEKLAAWLFSMKGSPPSSLTSVKTGACLYIFEKNILISTIEKLSKK